MSAGSTGGPPAAGAKLCDLARLLERYGRPREETLVFTNGVFDVLHRGHVEYLEAARALGDRLVVGLNSDASVRRLKGPARPVNPQEDRAVVLGGLAAVDAVVVFEEDTPVAALRRVQPDIWAKGGDYALTDLPEAGVLAEWGGHAVVLPYLDGRSTTALIGAARERATTSGELP